MTLDFMVGGFIATNQSKRKLGGGEGIEGVYGSLTTSSFARIVQVMQTKCGFDNTNNLIDIDQTIS